MSKSRTDWAGGPLSPLDGRMIEQYDHDGFLLLPGEFLGNGVADAIKSAMPALLAEDSPRRIFERDGTTVRTVYGVHQNDPLITDVVRLPRLLGAVMQLIGDEVYVHQSKINVKAPYSGDQWEWHQDYIYWLHGDGIERPDLVNAAIFLDDVTEFNGPLTFIRGSHSDGVLAAADIDGMPRGYEDAPAWVATLTATEKFQVSRETIEDLARRKGLASPKGPAGSVMFFHPNILHSSGQNISPFRRAMLLLVYNSVRNVPESVVSPRPKFLAERDRRPLRPLSYPVS